MVVTIPEASQWLDHDTKHDQTRVISLGIGTVGTVFLFKMNALGWLKK